jgi:hypothetical protein
MSVLSHVSSMYGGALLFASASNADTMSTRPLRTAWMVIQLLIRKSLIRCLMTQGAFRTTDVR